MEIAIFDPSGNHGHFAYTLSEIFNKDSLTWFLHESVTDRLYNKGCFNKGIHSIFTYSKNKNKWGFYIQSLKYLNQKKWDCIFFNTLESNWLINFLFFLFIGKKHQLILTVHNINSFFTKNYTLSLKASLKYHTRKLALKKCKLNVYSETLKQHVLKFKPDASLFSIPYKVYSPSSLDLESKTGEFRIVIPGSVDLKRRDYSFVLKVIENTAHLENIHFVLLGRPYGEGSEEMIEHFNQFGDRVTTYLEFVSEQEFENQMLMADLIWGPLSKFYETAEAREEYGISKETGITFAIIRYALPGIFPSDIKIMDEIKSGITLYSNLEDAVDIIKDISQNKMKLDQLRNNALTNARMFSPENVKTQFLKQFFNQ